MTVPLVILAVLSVFAGWRWFSGWFFGTLHGGAGEDGSHSWHVPLFATAVFVIGIVVAGASMRRRAEPLGGVMSSSAASSTSMSFTPR